MSGAYAEFREAAARRCRAYWLLARLLGEQPDRAMLLEIAPGLEQASAGVPGPAELTALGEAARVAVDNADALMALQVEFTRLLSGVSKSGSAPEPYESIAREGRLFGEAAESVAVHYAQAGVREELGAFGPADDLRTELRFMALLCYREMEAWKDAALAEAGSILRREQAFLDEHLLAWAPAWFEALASATAHPFYVSLAAIAQRALQDDRSDVSVLQERTVC